MRPAESKTIEPAAALCIVRLVEVLSHFPWVVPCAAVAAEEVTIASLLAALIPQLDMRLATFARFPLSTVLPRQIVEAVRRRPSPTPDVMSRYVIERLQASELGHLLTLQFRQVVNEEPATACASLATFSRTFRRYGRWSAKDWRAIARLALVLSPRHSPPPCSPLTFSRHSRKYLGIAGSHALTLVGWEWVIEAALSTGGYRSSRTKAGEGLKERLSGAVAGSA